VAGGQIETVPGDLEGNARRIRESMRWAEEQGADVLVLPEMALTGYLLLDLVLRADFVDASMRALAELAECSGRTVTVLGTVRRVPPRRGIDTRPRSVAISAALLCDGEMRGVYDKVLLPTYEGFEEGRYYAPGERPEAVWRIGEAVVGVSICEDAWSEDGPPEAQAAAGARILLVPNASSFHRGKPAGRLALVRRVARRNGLPFVYVNSVGGQDELVFDGGSLVVDGDGEVLFRAAQFEAENFVLDVPLPPERPLAGRPATIHARVRPRRAAVQSPSSGPALDPLEQIWRALVLGTRDFVGHTGFDGAVVGLSGGIDSALTTAVAAEALGPDGVLALAMPGSETSGHETETARAVASALGVELRVVPLATYLEGNALVEHALGRGLRAAEESELAPRVRATVLMAVADELGLLALACGNKTSLSIGASVLFGDMAGEFAPLRDCPKSLLYELAAHLRRSGRSLPQEAIEPSATLRSRARGLPSDDVLDAIVERYVERREDMREIVAAGFDPATVRGVLQLVDDAEFKRRQIAPGVKITSRAFGSDRRMPIASAWRPFRADEPVVPALSRRTRRGLPATSPSDPLGGAARGPVP
jgi:NAD+ synthase (glutamine-hydrolysing)